MDNELYKIFEKTYFNHKYYLKEFKGAGAFGAVFLADEVVGGTKIQEVAIKAIRKDKMPSDIIAKELVTAIRLKHPNLINCITSEEGRLKHSVFDYDCFGLVMEVASGTLEDYLQASRVLPAIEVKEIVEAIASGLVYLHGQSVTHRDLKPANVLRVGNVWKISDFGIARQMGRESGTMTTSLTGTPIYMPPEVYAASSEASPMRVSPAWDIWSLGVMIVEMLTGTLPFDGVTDIWKMKINIKRELPKPFDALVQNCLIEDPKQRWNAKQILEKNTKVTVKVKDVDFYFDSALEKNNKGDYNGAISDYNKVIHLDSKNAVAYCNRGLAKSELGDNQEAISDYNKAINLDPELAIAYNNRGLAKANLGDNQEAISDCNKAINLDPELAIAYCNRSAARLGLGEYQEMISDCNKAISLNPNLAIAYNNRGLAKANLGNKKQAIYDYNKAISLNPNLAYAYYNRSAMRLELGDKKGAISDLSKAIELDPQDSNNYNNRGIIKYELEDKRGAISDYNEAIRLNPNNSDAYYNRGLIKQEKFDKKGALADLREASRIYKLQGNTIRLKNTRDYIRAIE
ncbi:protein kinase domain-containing protein [Pseudanabaena sp. CCNP1317]|uniref:protein kinase domain-containing protein n=1 Tax=Pseudanabaena sp. CCNP1317 TaxID=3110253 RepID=UPI002B1EF603|nr:tetratricopeptide repeat protein [Pseudanabaena sp. CCNP1317]MEA5488158.1 tetratricopeptide repeat protein [Pseudanabaena sp. CCNP1317]